MDDASRGFPSELHCLNISEVELEKGRERARERGLSEHMIFHLMDAHKLAFPDCSFDCVYGGAIFHHLDCTIAFREVARVLKPRGRFVLTEPLGMNPIGRLVRQLTPEARTPDEKPFDMVEFSLIREHFTITDWQAYDAFSVPASVLSAMIFRSPSNPVSRLGDLIDRALFSTLNPIKYWANQSLFDLCKKNQ